MSKEIDHDMTDEIVCPYCGYEDSDSWERNLDNGGSEKMNCESCDEVFIVSKDIAVTYTTKK